MKKKSSPKKIYMLTAKVKEVSHVFHTENELDAFLEKYNNYYTKKRVQTIYSNLKIDRKKYPGLILVTAEELHRLEPVERTLDDIDTLTASKDNSLRVKEEFNFSDLQGLPLVIAYKSKKDYRTLPVIYKKDSDYLNSEVLTKSIIDLSLSNPKFLSLVNTYDKFNNDLSMGSYLEKILVQNERYKLFTKTESKEIAEIGKEKLVDEIKNFITAWCKPKNKKGVRDFSYRRFRDLVNFVIEFNNKELEKELKDDSEKFEQLSWFNNSYKLGGNNGKK